MKTSLSKEQIEDFWIRCYMNTTEGYFMAAINRAYLDFNRTWKNTFDSQTERDRVKNQMAAILLESIQLLFQKMCSNQEEFDSWHQKTCFRLRTMDEYLNPDNNKVKSLLTQGQAQKWVNMALKYLFAFGENRVKGSTINYEFYHVPIDNIIMEKLYKEHGINKFDVAWSKVQDYSEYMLYQINIRDTFKNQIPMDVEFELFNAS